MPLRQLLSLYLRAPLVYTSASNINGRIGIRPIRSLPVSNLVPCFGVAVFSEEFSCGFPVVNDGTLREIMEDIFFGTNNDDAFVPSVGVAGLPVTAPTDEGLVRALGEQHEGVSLLDVLDVHRGGIQQVGVVVVFQLGVAWCVLE